MRRALLVLLLASCRQIFGLHELADKKGDAGSAAVDCRIDAATDARPDSRSDAPPPDASRVVGIPCGSGLVCDPTMQQFCCYGTASDCQNTGSCSIPQKKLECDDASDCTGGKFCCVSYDPSMNVTQTACTASNAPCAAPGGGGSTGWFCDPLMASPCPSPMVCTKASNLTGMPPGDYSLCQ